MREKGSATNCSVTFSRLFREIGVNVTGTLRGARGWENLLTASRVRLRIWPEVPSVKYLTLCHISSQGRPDHCRPPSAALMRKKSAMSLSFDSWIGEFWMSKTFR